MLAALSGSDRPSRVTPASGFCGGGISCPCIHLRRGIRAGRDVLDPLTGLLNRSGLEGRVHELAEQARQTGQPISVLICDLDRFKAINDVRGHAVGDAVLQDVAYELRKQLRSFELLYRIGGEEFLVVLPGATEQDAFALGERMRGAVRRSPAQGIPVTISVGVSTSRGAEVQFATLVGAADRALHRAKAEGRDRVTTSALDDAERLPPSAPLAAARHSA